MFHGTAAPPVDPLCAVGGEESGLIGSQYYAENPTFPPGRIAANINIDGINIFGRTKDIIMVGLGKSSIDDIVQSIAAWLSDAHRIYHYTRLGDHILLTPNGVVALETVNLEGVFTYQKGRWKQKFSVSRALRFIVEERLGDPASAATGSAELVKRYLREGTPEGLESQVGATPVQALVVFTHPNAQVVAKDAPIPVAQPDKLLKKIPHPGQKMAPDLYQYVRGKLDALLPSSE